MFKTYHYEIPLPFGEIYVSYEYETIEECVQDCKWKCEECHVDYNDREVKLFLTDLDGTEECTEEGELAG